MLAVGPLGRAAARAFGAGGEHFDSVDALIARAQGLTALKGTMLVKGSRFMRMERVVAAPGDAGGGMLLELAQCLAQDVRAFNVFNYITLRAVLAALTALVISFLAGPAMIRKLTAYKIGQSVRDDGPQIASHQGRHADHGRRAGPGLGRRHDLPLGRSGPTASSGSCSR